MGADAHRPKRSLGQNFLVDQNVQRKIVDALEAGAGDVVVEIGPGRGALTRHLVGRVRRLVLVELDDDLAGSLKAAYGSRSDVEVVHSDILEVSVTNLVGGVADAEGAKVIGNIPYNITTPILFHLLTRPRPREIVLMVQDDVAARIVAAPGGKEYGALSVGVRTVAEVERLFKVGRKAFRPVPRVDSAVIRVRPFRPARLSVEQERDLRDLVRATFQWRRKQLGKILREHPTLAYPAPVVRAAADQAQVLLTDRPERVTPEQFVALSAALP